MIMINYIATLHVDFELYTGSYLIEDMHNFVCPKMDTNLFL